METPFSTRRITRSQASAMAASNNSNFPNSKSEKCATKSRKSAEKQKQDRSALIDITNDSPIVGLAIGNLETPSSAMSKRRIISLAKYTRTPGSGEALLRAQVKTLLQKVEEEAEISKITMEKRQLFDLQGLINSPSISLVAPTSANTPQVLNFSVNGGLPSVSPSTVDEKILISQMPSVSPSTVDEKILISQMMGDMIQGKEEKSDDLVTRSLPFDFSEKSQKLDSPDSVVTYEESSREKVSTDDDDSSIWSIQVNASSTRDDEDEEECYDYAEHESENYDGEEEDYGGNYRLLDELCEGMSNISVGGIPKFTGKHIRFVYNSDDELQGEDEVSLSGASIVMAD